MNKINIKKLFENKQAQMLANFGLSMGFEHPVSKGDATEQEWRNWFTNFFPDRYKAEKAFVIDSEGNCSDQIDVVVYDTHFSPTIFEYNNEKYIPAESVYAVFEVKPVLNKDYLEYAIGKISSVKKLIRTSAPIRTIRGIEPGRPAQEIIGGILTYKSDWVENNIEKNLISHIGTMTSNKYMQLDFICSLSSYACSIIHTPEISSFHNKEIYIPNFSIVNNGQNTPLIFTYFKLLRMLQNMGNAPAIDYAKYGISGIE